MADERNRVQQLALYEQLVSLGEQLGAAIDRRGGQSRFFAFVDVLIDCFRLCGQINRAPETERLSNSFEIGKELRRVFAPRLVILFKRIQQLTHSNALLRWSYERRTAVPLGRYLGEALLEACLSLFVILLGLFRILIWTDRLDSRAFANFLTVATVGDPPEGASLTCEGSPVSSSQLLPPMRLSRTVYNVMPLWRMYSSIPRALNRNPHPHFCAKGSFFQWR